MKDGLTFLGIPRCTALEGDAVSCWHSGWNDVVVLLLVVTRCMVSTPPKPGS